MNKIFNWFNAFLLMLGVFLGYFLKDNSGKADEVTNIENNTKIKANKGVIETSTEVSVAPKSETQKKKFTLFRKRKNKI
jgi:hypothetical protein